MSLRQSFPSSHKIDRVAGIEPRIERACRSMLLVVGFEGIQKSLKAGESGITVAHDLLRLRRFDRIVAGFEDIGNQVANAHDALFERVVWKQDRQNSALVSPLQLEVTAK